MFRKIGFSNPVFFYCFLPVLMGTFLPTFSLKYYGTSASFSSLIPRPHEFKRSTRLPLRSHLIALQICIYTSNTFFYRNSGTLFRLLASLSPTTFIYSTSVSILYFLKFYFFLLSVLLTNVFLIFFTFSATKTQVITITYHGVKR